MPRNPFEIVQNHCEYMTAQARKLKNHCNVTAPDFSVDDPYCVMSGMFFPWRMNSLFFSQISCVCASFSGESAYVCGLDCLCCALIRFCLPFVLLKVWEVIAAREPRITSERDALLRKSCRLRGLDTVSVSLTIKDLRLVCAIDPDRAHNPIYKTPFC